MKTNRPKAYYAWQKQTVNLKRAIKDMVGKTNVTKRSKYSRVQVGKYENNGSENSTY